MSLHQNQAFKNSFKSKIWKSIFITYCTLLIIHPFIGMAQSYELVGVKPNQSSTVDSNAAHWQVQTLAKSRTTKVQFFDASQKSIYEETLPGKWVKQNRKSRRQLDKLLAQIVTNKLVISRLKVEDLPTMPYPQLSRSRFEDIPLATGEPTTTTSYKVFAFVSVDGKVNVTVENPERLTYKIEIVDDQQHIVYQEFTRLDRYRRTLDISPLRSSSLKVVIGIAKERYVYEVHQQDIKSQYSMKPIGSMAQ
jgi:hypothetical protein